MTLLDSASRTAIAALRNAVGSCAKVLVIQIAIVAPPPLYAGQRSDLAGQLEGLRHADLALGDVAYRLDLANDELCLKHGPLTGLVLHSRGDYDESVRAAVVRHFDFESAIGVEGVVPGSPAARAGIRPDDSVVAVDGVAIAADESRADALSAIDAEGVDRPIELTLRHAGQVRTAVIAPVQGCLAHAEVDVSDDRNAATDGKTIEVDSGLINLVGSDEGALAAIVAHELAHIVLDHPRRLTAAHVSRGLFKGFGRSARLFKQTENEADRLSVTLMANAGYDPQAAVRYWLTYGPRLNDHGGLGSTHLSWRDRARLIARAAAAIPAGAPRPIIPAWIESRTQPLS